MTPFHPSKFLLLAILACGVIPPRAQAGAEKSFPDSNFAVTIPDAWLDLKGNPAFKKATVAYTDPQRKRTVLIMVDDSISARKEWGTVEAFVFEQVMEKGTRGQKLSGRFVTIEGIKSYEFTETLNINGKVAYSVIRAIPIRGRAYVVEAVRSDGGKAEEDPDIRQFLDSFHFLTPPEPLPANDPTLGFGQFSGRNAIPGLVILGVIALVLIVICRASGKPTASRIPSPIPPRGPQVPPPLPK